MTTFQILNESSRDIIIVNEPNGFEFVLSNKIEITIEIESLKNAITLRHSIRENQIVIALLDDSSNYRVLSEGVDVFEKFV
jgi:hypothetical protein